MEFLNPFLSEETEIMKTYLKQISSPLSEDCWIPSLSYPVEKADLGKYLSALHTILFENASKVPGENPKSVKLRSLLDEINSILKRPTIPQLEQISTPTMDTLKIKAEEKQKTFAGIPIPWLGTLPKKNKSHQNSSQLSHPAPHHTTSSHLLGKSTSAHAIKSPMNNALGVNEGVSLSSETSSSSASLTPSPGTGPGKSRPNIVGSNWPNDDRANSTSSSSSSSVILTGATGRHSHHSSSTLDPYLLHQRRSSKLKFPSSMSLDETDSSDDSTYSSQYQSDANSTPRTGTSHTLPRNMRTNSTVIAAVSNNTVKVNTVKTMTDYESEILQMRSQMDALQSKLSEAERQLQLNCTNEIPQVKTSEVGTSIVRNLMREEDKLRREHLDKPEPQNETLSEKEKMIVMQQKKFRLLTQPTKDYLKN
jgi:hypothetical protein